MSQNAGLVLAQTPAASRRAKPRHARGAPSRQPRVPIDGGWPRSYTTNSGAALVIYQPQIATWDKQKLMTAYAAASYTPPGAAEAGARHVPDRGRHRACRWPSGSSASRSTVSLEANFSTLDKDQLRTVVAEVTTSVPPKERVLALDRVLAAIDKSQIIPKNVEGVKADPPPIFFSDKPAILVNIDGDPIWSPIKENDLKFAVNTNWDLFQHEPSKTFYLLNNDAWLKAADVKGPWEPAGKLPESFKKLPADDNWKDVKANLPGKKGKPTTVFVSTVPAELILLDEGAELRARAGHQRSAVGQQHRERRLPHGQDRAGLLPRGRPVVHVAGVHRAVDVRDAARCRPRSSRFPSSMRARACWRPCPAPMQAVEGGPARVDSADRDRQPEGREGARRRVPGRSEVRADSLDDGRARRQHRQGHHQGR